MVNDKYIFETESTREMELITSRHKLISVLDDINDWRRNIYKGYDNNLKILCNGKLYTFISFRKTNFNKCSIQSKNVYNFCCIKKIKILSF